MTSTKDCFTPLKTDIHLNFVQEFHSSLTDNAKLFHPIKTNGYQYVVQ